MNEVRNKLKVLYLITDLGTGGAERYLIDLCNELGKMESIEFRIGMLFDRNDFGESTAHLPLVNLNFKTFSLFGTNRCPEYESLLKEFRPHIIHTHRFLAEFLSSYYVFPEMQYICHCHDNMVQFKPMSFKALFNRKSLLNIIERSVIAMRKYSRTDCHFICNSSNTLEFYKKVLPSKMRRNIHLIEVGFNYERFRISRKRELPDGEMKLQLINIGSFQDKKNQVFLISVAEKLRDAGVKFQLHLIGTGKNQDRVRQQIENSNLSQSVYLHGRVDSVADYISRSHFYIHAALYEPFGIVFLEAMAGGLPCVSLDGKGNRAFFESGKTGRLIPFEDAGRFADAIVELATDKARYREMSEFCKIFAEQFRIERKGKEMMNFYYNLIAPIVEE